MIRPQLRPRLSLEADTTQPSVEWSVEEEEICGGVLIRAIVRNTGRNQIRVRAIDVRFDLPFDRDARALRIAYCGAHSASSQSRSDVRVVHDSVVESWWVGARFGSGGGVVVGAIDYTRWVSAVFISSDSIVTRCWLENAVALPGAELNVPDVWISTSQGPPFDELESFAFLVGERHRSRPLKSPCGWGSWGQFSERVDEALVRETMFAISGSQHFRDVVDVVQIDDGWAQLLDNARVCASWQPNGRFAWGIAPLAANLAGTDRRTGLWVLPFTANEGATVVSDHPEFLVGYRTGNPLRVGGGTSFVFDPTHAEAAAELRRTFRRFKDWGVRYLKLDFLRALLAPEPLNSVDDIQTARPYAGICTRAEAYRRGLELIRDAVGDETFLLGCSSPLGAGAGLLDAQRIGPDIEAVWIGHRAGIRDCTKAVAANWFWHGRAWINDPDYLVSGSSVHESRFWSAAVALSGGSSILSVDLEEMEPWREELLSFVTPPCGRSARPLDLFTSAGEPAVWALPCSAGEDSWVVLGMFNWKEVASEIRIPLTELNIEGTAHVWDAWRRSYSLEHDHVHINIEAHDARIIAVRKADGRPSVVGTDIHFTQGERELVGTHWENSTLRLDPTPTFRDGTITVWSPIHLQPTGDFQAVRHSSGWLISVPWQPGGNSVVISFFGNVGNT